jgi:hypothetical protein
VSEKSKKISRGIHVYVLRSAGDYALKLSNSVWLDLPKRQDQAL